MLRDDYGFISVSEPEIADLFPFETVTEGGNILHKAFRKRAVFGRETTFDEDLIALKKKWIRTDNEVLVNHMIDSLILFNHNRKQISDVSTGGKFGNTEVREAILVQSPDKKRW